MTETEPRVPAQASSSEPAEPHDVFVSYSRADREIVVELVAGLQARELRAWVDLEDIPPSAEWMAEIRAAIEASDGYLVVVSPSLASSKVCAEELELAREAGKRIVPVMVRTTDPGSVPGTLAALNWIDATDGALDQALDRAVEALRTDLDRVRAHSRLIVRAREWSARGEDRASLLRGSELAEAEAMIGRDEDPRATPDQTRFVVASRQGSARKQRGVTTGVTVALVIAAFLGVFAWSQRGQAIEQRRKAETQASVANSRGLAINAVSKMDEELALGALLAIAAHRIAPTPESIDAIHFAAQTTTWVSGVMRAQSLRMPIAFSPDATLLVAGNSDGNLMVLDVRTGTQVGPPWEAHAAAISSVAFDASGHTLASGSDDGEVILWDLATRTRLGERLEGLQSRVHTLAFSRDGTTLAAGVTGGVWRWEVRSGRQLGPPLKHKGRVDALTFVPGGEELLSGSLRAALDDSGPATTRVWDLETGKRVGRVLHSGSAIRLAFSQDGAIFASGDIVGEVVMRSVRTGEQVGRRLRAPDAVTGLAFTPDGAILATGSRDGLVQLWDTASGDELGGGLLGQEGEVYSLAFAPEGGLLASGGQTGAVVWSVPWVHRPDRTWDPSDVAFSPDDSLLASDFGVFDRATAKWVSMRLHDSSAFTWTLAFSPDGELLASGNTDGTVTLLDPVTGLPRLKPLRGPVEERAAKLPGLVDVAFSPDGEMLASGTNDAAVTLWDPSTGRRPGAPLRGHAKAVYDVDFSPDGTLLATGSPDGTVVLWDLGTREPIRQPLEFTTEVWEIAFSPDGTMLAIGTLDGDITIIDVPSGDVIGEPLRGHTAAIPSLQFHPDGRTLASGSLDGTIALWDVPAGELIGEPLPAYGNPWALDFSSDGTILASGGSGVILLHDADAWTSDIVAIEERLCRVAGRDLTLAEWEQFLPFAPYEPTCPGNPAEG